MIPVSHEDGMVRMELSVRGRKVWVRLWVGKCAVSMLDEESGVLRSNSHSGLIRRSVNSNANTYGWFKGVTINIGTKYAGIGGASRFFYCSQARKGERVGNPHPTVKPLDLVRRLVRLFYSKVERLYPHAVKFELFARTPRAGYVQWGLESNKFDGGGNGAP